MSKQTPRAYLERDAAEWERDGWTSCPNAILRHPDLPWELRAVWAWLASHTSTFELTAEKLREAGPKGRDWAYNALRELERWGLLTRHHEVAKGGRPVVRYRLHHRPVAEEQRTYEASKATPRDRQHPRVKERTPDGSGIRPELGVSDLPDMRVTPDPPGRGTPDPPGVPYKEENTNKKTNQPAPAASPPVEPVPAPGWLVGDPAPPPEPPAASSTGTPPSPGAELLASLPQAPGKAFVTKLAPTVDALLAAGWSPEQLRKRWTANLDTVDRLVPNLRWRIGDTPMPARSTERQPQAGRPEWCGECDESTRLRELDDGQFAPCPTCSPRARSRANVA